MYDTQLGRRNLNAVQRVAALQDYDKLLEELAAIKHAEAVAEANKRRDPSAQNSERMESDRDQSRRPKCLPKKQECHMTHTPRQPPFSTLIMKKLSRKRCPVSTVSIRLITRTQ